MDTLYTIHGVSYSSSFPQVKSFLFYSLTQLIESSSFRVVEMGDRYNCTKPSYKQAPVPQQNFNCLR